MNMLYVPADKIEEFTMTNGNGRFIEPVQFQEGYGIWPGTLENPDDAWAWPKLSELTEVEMIPLSPGSPNDRESSY